MRSREADQPCAPSARELLCKTRPVIDKPIGHYQIVAKIGAGGMGEVYRARDTRLNRDVAIKVLPEALAADPDRLVRFDREAESLAALCRWPTHSRSRGRLPMRSTPRTSRASSIAI